MASAIPFPSLPFSAPESAVKNALSAVGSQTQFKFELPDLKESFGVLRFEGHAALSHNYSYRIHVESADPLDADKYAGVAGRLSVENGGPRAGHVETVEYQGPTNNGHEYVFVLESPLAPLKHTLDSTLPRHHLQYHQRVGIGSFLPFYKTIALLESLLWRWCFSRRLSTAVTSCRASTLSDLREIYGISGRPET